MKENKQMVRIDCMDDPRIFDLETWKRLNVDQLLQLYQILPRAEALAKDANARMLFSIAMVKALATCHSYGFTMLQRAREVLFCHPENDRKTTTSRKRPRDMRRKYSTMHPCFT